MNIRPSQNTDADLGIYVRLQNTVHPERPRTVEELRHYQATRGPEDVSVGFFAEIDGEAVGWADYRTPMNPVVGQLEVEYGLLQGHENLTAPLWAFLETKIARQGGKELIARVREDWPELSFYESQGFSPYEHSWASTLDLETFDPEPLERSLPLHISVKTLAHLDLGDEAVQRRFYELTVTLLRDVPWSEPLEVWPFELWQKRALGDAKFIPEANFVAFDGEKMVGLSQLFKSNRPQTIGTGLTGTLSTHRRMGIAQALKLRAAEYAKAHGYRYIRTTNHQVNRPMLSLNEAMGFAKEPAWLALKKEL